MLTAILVSIGALLVQAEPRLDSITQAMKPFVDDREIAGVVTLVAVDGQVVHLEALGQASIDKSFPMKADSIFSIASMTKPTAATAALILVGEGKLSLDDLLKDRLPEFADGKHERITIRHLLTHTSGLVGNQQNEGTLAETMKVFAARPVAFAPGKTWAYSPAISVIGRVVEVVSGMPFDQFQNERIFKPLGMKDTSYKPPADESRLARIYKTSTDGKGLVETDNWFLGDPATRTPNPSGGLYSTAPDYFRFLEMLLNGGELDGARILTKEVAAEMVTMQTGDLKAGFVPGSAWGLGVGIVREPTGVTETLSPGTFGHGGLYGTQAWADPKTKAVYILLIQRMGLVNSDASPYRKAFQDAAGKEVARLKSLEPQWERHGEPPQA